MSDRIMIGLVDFAAFSFEFDRWTLARSFLVRNWCGPWPTVETVGGQSGRRSFRYSTRSGSHLLKRSHLLKLRLSACDRPLGDDGPGCSLAAPIVIPKRAVALPTEANGQGRAAARSRDRAPCFLGVLHTDRDPLPTNPFSSPLFCSPQPPPLGLPQFFGLGRKAVSCFDLAAFPFVRYRRSCDATRP